MSKKTETERDDAFIERLLEAIELAGGENALAQKSGVSRASIDKYKAGSEPSRSYLVKIAKAAGVSVSWLAAGDGAKTVDEEGPFVPIPVYPTRASAGGGAAVYFDEVGEHFPMSRLWLERHRLKPSELFIIYGVGESMEPAIDSGSKLLCSKAEYHLSGDGIFIIRQDGDLMVKRLQRLPGIIRVLPENPEYQAYDVPLNDGVDFKIIGRVLYKDTILRVG